MKNQYLRVRLLLLKCIAPRGKNVDLMPIFNQSIKKWLTKMKLQQANITKLFFIRKL